MAHPFDLKKLDPEIAAAIANYRPYETDRAIAAIIDRKGLTDAESCVALAFFIWANAGVTEFDEDVLQFGAEALEVLNRAPVHRGARTLRKAIEQRIRKAEKVQRQLAKLTSVPEERLSLEEARELAFFLAEHKKDPESKRKEHRLWHRLYLSTPDTAMEDGAPGASHGDRYFYLGYAAVALWEAGEREQARPLFWELIRWPVERDVKLYDRVSITVPHLLLEAAENDDASEFRRLAELMETHYRALGKRAVIYTRHADQILEYAVRRGDAASVRYIVGDLMHERSDRSMDAATKANMARARDMLSDGV